MLLHSVYNIMLMDVNIFSYLVISFVIAVQARRLVVYMCIFVILAKPYVRKGGTKRI